MGELFLIDGDEDSATEAFNQHLLAASEDPRLIHAIKRFNAGKTGQAEQLCRDFLKDHPANVTAIRLLAEVGLKVGVLVDAERLLERCLELAMSHRFMRQDIVHQQGGTFGHSSRPAAGAKSGLLRLGCYAGLHFVQYDTLDGNFA